MYDFSRKALLHLAKGLSKHKMIICSKNVGGHAPLGPLATPMHRHRRRMFLGTPHIIFWYSVGYSE